MMDYLQCLTDVTEYEMYLFLAVIVQMGRGLHGSLKGYWLTDEQFFSPFCGTP
jgi:hypothetical protein